MPNSAAPALHPNIKLSQSGSLLLDIVRFGAAFLVLAEHLNTDPHFTTGWGDYGAVGHEAVCIFFVLSGFVIRFITVTRVGTALEYSIDRVSRIYSIAVPAILFTIACELLAGAFFPSYHQAIRGVPDWAALPTQVARTLTWTAQCWGYPIFPLINSPFWSLSYECIYYALYALVHYRVRRAWLWITLILIIAGPAIAFLYPVWLLGAYSCDVYLRLARKPNRVSLSGLFLAALLLFLVLVRHPLVAAIHATDAMQRTVWITALVTRTIPFHQSLLFDGKVPWLIQASNTFYLVGLLTAAFMVFGLTFLDRYHPTLPPFVTRWTRLVADSTFTLYLFHVPMLMLLFSAIGHPISSLPLFAFILIGTVLVTVPISLALDQLKLWMRSALRHRFAAYLPKRVRSASA